MDKNNFRSKSMIIIFIIVQVSVILLNIMIPDKDFSESENRYLQQAPKFSFDSLFEGEFTEDYEKYIMDQFAFKDYWVFFKTTIERLALKTIRNGIYFGKDDFLLEDYKKSDEQLIKNISSINSFSEKLQDMNTYFMLVPNAVKVYEDKLPLFASPYDQLETLEFAKRNLNEKLTFINPYNLLYKNKDEYIYFKTDHHWTMKGAYYGYLAFCQAVGIKPYALDDFTSAVVSDSFHGTFYSKVNYLTMPYDYIEVYTGKEDRDYTVNYADVDKISNTLYEYSYLDKKDKYSFFLDGNHALLTIHTKNSDHIGNNKEDKKILVIKDSYAHAFIPFLTDHYSEIHVIDLRYYKKNIYDYIKENNIKETLILYNVSTFAKDNNLPLIH